MFMSMPGNWNRSNPKDKMKPALLKSKTRQIRQILESDEKTPVKADIS